MDSIAEAMADSNLETQHLYRQISALKHGAPETPMRVKRRLVERESSPPPRVETKQGSSIWPVVLSVAGILASAGGGAALAKYLSKPEAPQVQPQTLLEFLDQEGLNR